MVLDPAQIRSLQAITGALKFLTIFNICSYRVAQTGCLPLLIQLTESTNLLIRRNSHCTVGACFMMRSDPMHAFGASCCCSRAASKRRIVCIITYLGPLLPHTVFWRPP